jgi:Fe2+ transport system protein FeoA
MLEERFRKQLLVLGMVSWLGFMESKQIQLVLKQMMGDSLKQLWLVQ